MDALAESGGTTLLEPQVKWDADEVCAGIAEPEPFEEEQEDPLSVLPALTT